MRIKSDNIIPINIFLWFLMFFQSTKIIKNIGNMMSAWLYLVKNDIIDRGKERRKYLESFFTAKNVKYNAQIVMETLGRSATPAPK